MEPSKRIYKLSVLALVVWTFSASSAFPNSKHLTQRNVGVQGSKNAVAVKPLKVLITLINFQDNPYRPFTEGEMHEKTFLAQDSVRSFYKETSYEQVNIEGDVVEWMTLPFSSAGKCDEVVWENAANEELVRKGINSSSYDVRLFIWPAKNPGLRTSCNYSGISQRNININTAAPYPPVRMIIHELGHYLYRFPHANVLDCGANMVPEVANCTVREYADPYDTMGNLSNATFGVGFRFKAGWLKQNEIQTIHSSGTYELHRLDVLGSQIKALRIKKPNTNSSYYFTYRPPVSTSAFDHNLPEGGTFAHLISTINFSDGSFEIKTHELLIANRGSDFEIRSGQSFYDEVSRIRVTQISYNADTVTLQIDFQ